MMDVTYSEKAFQEIEAPKDELYKENIVLREEVDKTSNCSVKRREPLRGRSRGGLAASNWQKEARSSSMRLANCQWKPKLLYCVFCKSVNSNVSVELSLFALTYG
jgi:hypothetical protein